MAMRNGKPGLSGEAFVIPHLTLPVGQPFCLCSNCLNFKFDLCCVLCGVCCVVCCGVCVCVCVCVCGFGCVGVCVCG